MKRFLALVAVGVTIGAASAQAATLTLSGSTTSLAIGTLPSIEIPQTVDPVLIFVSSGTGGFVEPAGVFSSSVIVPPQLFTGISLISSLNVSLANGTKSLTAGGGIAGGFGGPGAFEGQAVVGVLGGLINLVIPLNVVGGGGATAVGAAALMITVTGHIWTTGTAFVTGVDGVTTGGSPVTFTSTRVGSDTRTNGHVGRLTLVTPFRVDTGAAVGVLSGFAVQTLEFAPEPAGLVLIATGVLGIAAIYQRRIRK